MIEIKTWADLHRLLVNREAEYMVPDRPMPKISNRKLVAWVKSQRVKDYDPGIYNFVRYTVKHLLP